jgi:DNA-binding NarL/FixJ family response regulator
MVRTNICLAGGTAAARGALAVALAEAGFDVVGSFADAGVCAEAAGRIDEPELVLLLIPGKGRVLEADVLTVKRMYPEASAVVLGDGTTRAELTGYIDAGLDGYLPGSIETRALAQSLRVILLGEQLYITGTKAAAARVMRSDRRASPRRRTIRRASILVDGKSGIMDGMVLDMSETGAKIRPADIAGLPSRFELRCGFGQTYLCEIVRRSAFYLGVQFVDAATAA